MRHFSFVFIIIALTIAISVLIGCRQEPASSPNTAKPRNFESIKRELEKAKAEKDSKNSDKSPNLNARKQEAQKIPQQLEHPPIVVSTDGVVLNWVEDGKLRMSARAREISGDEVTKTGTLIDFSAKLYENGKLTAEMSAPKAVADTQNRIVTATGDVFLRSVERKTTVRAKWIRWYAKQKKIIGSGGIKIESALGTMEAAAFVANTELKSLKLLSSSKGLE